MHHREGVALGRLLAAATAAAGCDGDHADDDIAGLVAAAPQSDIPAAAAFHRVEGCVHEALHTVAGVDPDVLATLALARERAVRQHLLRVRALARFGQVMADAGVPWVVLKGVVLATLLYRDPGLRSSVDVDILVARHDFVRAVVALEHAGYRHLVHNWPMVLDSGAGELTLSDGTVSIDLHWHLLYATRDREGIRFDPQQLLDRARTVTVGGREVRTFDAVDTLLHLGVHATASGGDRLVWLKDIERSLRVEHPDLDELARRARAMECAPMVGLALRRAAVTLGAPVPAGLARSLSGRALVVLDRAVTAWAPPERADEDGSPARMLARGTRTGLDATIADLGHITLHRFTSFVTRRPDPRGLDPARPNVLTHAVGGPLDKQAYLDWVERPPAAGRYVVRRARHTVDLAAALAAHEPRTTAALVDVHASGLRPWRCRAWTVDRDGALAGAVVVQRSGFDRWHANAFLADPGAAPTVARVVDRSPAWSVSGPGSDVGPLLDHLARRRGLSAMPWVVAGPPVRLTTLPETDERVRLAQPGDLAALVGLYRGFELASETTVWQVRGTLRRVLRHHHMLVAEEDGRMVGALVVSGPTTRYFVADALTVLPEQRSRGIGWTLGARAQLMANDRGVGITAAIASSNAMSFADADLGPESWAAVGLHAPHRFRGQGKLRRLYGRIGRRVGRARVVLRDDAGPPTSS